MRRLPTRSTARSDRPPRGQARVADRDNIAEVAAEIYSRNTRTAGSRCSRSTTPPRDRARRRCDRRGPPRLHAFPRRFGRFDDVATYAADNASPVATRRLPAQGDRALRRGRGNHRGRESGPARNTPNADFTPEAERGRARRSSAAGWTTIRRSTCRADGLVRRGADHRPVRDGDGDHGLEPHANRSQRGATPWDAVVARFAGGFDNLPKPKSAEVGDAASTLKPY
jgi:hypothetical protein